MSHKATNWAFEQRGLSPPAWRVLVTLADRHNPDYGCFPSQGQLAVDAELSRRSVNRHLDELERLGLIRRQRRYCPHTKSNLSTRYILGFESEFTQEPCANLAQGASDTGGTRASATRGTRACVTGGTDLVSDWHTNPVSQPVTAAAREDRHPEAACLAVAGPGLTESSRSELRSSRDVVKGWLEAGYDLDLDVLPVIRKKTARLRTTGLRTWDYFTAAIRDAHHRRMRLGSGSGPTAEKVARGAGAPPGTSALEILADRINQNLYLPSSAVTNTQRDELIRRKLVTAEQLRRIGVY